MASRVLSYCQFRNLNDFDFDLVHSNKSEIESGTCEIFDELLKNEENVLSVYTERKNEYLIRIKLEKEIGVLLQKQTHISHKHSQLLKKLQSLQREKENRDKKEEQIKVFMYEKNLGLKIEPASNTSISKEVAVSFSFHNINERNPNETSSFNLVITNGIAYKATDCHPSIAEMDEFISQLNKTNDLHCFIISVRKRLCESLK